MRCECKDGGFCPSGAPSLARWGIPVIAPTNYKEHHHHHRPFTDHDAAKGSYSITVKLAGENVQGPHSGILQRPRSRLKPMGCTSVHVNRPLSIHFWMRVSPRSAGYVGVSLMTLRRARQCGLVKAMCLDVGAHRYSTTIHFAQLPFAACDVSPRLMAPV